MKMRKAHGFTLTEIALSVGIATVCILALVGLIPYGLESLRHSSNRQAESRMIQTVVSYYQSTPWTKQAAGGTVTEILKDEIFFFDQAGVQIPAPNTIDHIYTVKAVLAPQAATLSGDSIINPYLRPIKLLFTQLPNYEAAFNDPEGRNYVERPTWIANTEQTGPQPKPGTTL